MINRNSLSLAIYANAETSISLESLFDYFNRFRGIQSIQKSHHQSNYNVYRITTNDANSYESILIQRYHFISNIRLTCWPQTDSPYSSDSPNVVIKGVPSSISAYDLKEHIEVYVGPVRWIEPLKKNHIPSKSSLEAVIRPSGQIKSTKIITEENYNETGSRERENIKFNPINYHSHHMSYLVTFRDILSAQEMLNLGRYEYTEHLSFRIEEFKSKGRYITHGIHGVATEKKDHNPFGKVKRNRKLPNERQSARVNNTTSIGSQMNDKWYEGKINMKETTKAESHVRNTIFNIPRAANYLERRDSSKHRRIDINAKVHDEKPSSRKYHTTKNNLIAFANEGLCLRLVVGIRDEALE